ncbi:tapT [Symbiodinium necroappetens]|uniref:tRNA-uridine aminocarboxypropyltransferase n=1 Tax=Symbiodinium necroappetens TaxID=1628268 RepID=A0A812RAG5_9DINO|nr:tapT [Symbiodinium necroappetens]
MTELGEALDSGSEALEQKQDHEEMSLPGVPPQDRERLRSEQAWASYQAFLTMPGDRCTQCWLMRKHCCCKGLPRIETRLRVYVLMHRLEIGQRKASNTAKLLKHFGAELLCWGVEEHDARLQQLLVDDEEGTVVLFPSPDAVEASSLAAAPRQVIVLDGGWRECVRMNSWISPRIRRCIVTTASRSELGGTRKYSGGTDDRVQTAAAFVTLLRELGEDQQEVASVRDGLAHYMECFEAQINRSKT